MKKSVPVKAPSGGGTREAANVNKKSASAAAGAPSNIIRKSPRSQVAPIFQKESGAVDLSLALLQNARKTGVLQLSGRDLIHVPSKVWNLNDLEEKEKASANNLSLDNTTEDKWWEFVDLEKLILANNRIIEIPAEIGSLISLQVLDAHDNHIKILAPEIGKLKNLQKLDLSLNKLSHLPMELYRLKRLNDLKLGHNEIVEISAEISQLDGLRQLDLSNNNLSSLPGDVGFLCFLTQLNISDNKIQDLPPDFGGLTGLRMFDASNNCISSLPNFINQMSHLEILSLCKNKLQHIPALDGCTKLKEIFMQNNLITEFNSKSFRTTKVQLLDFRYNKIHNLEIKTSDLEHVDRFYLNNNDIGSIPDDLARLPSLKQVTLEGNPLKGIRVDILQRGTIEILKYLKGRIRVSDENQSGNQILKKGSASVTSAESSHDIVSSTDLGIDIYKLKNTKVLNLVSRNIMGLENHVFVTATEAKVNVADFSKNTLSQFPTSFAELCPYLTELKLDFNRFTELPICIGSSCVQLQCLSFQNNFVSQLPDEFSNLQKLREINFGYNKFTEVPGCLYKLSSLEILIAPDNKISNINMKGLDKMRRLAVLDLRNNNITQVPPELGLLTQLRSLSLEGNGFRVPGYAILSQGSDAVMRFLRNKVVPKP